MSSGIKNFPDDWLNNFKAGLLTGRYSHREVMFKKYDTVCYGLKYEM